MFDCLSELQSVWYTDLMMGNFFRVTCPYLFELDTVAYFPLIRGRHSFDTVARIRDTTQQLLNVYSGEKHLYLHPMKVWNRYSEKTFLPHRMRKETQELIIRSTIDPSALEYRRMPSPIEASAAVKRKIKNQAKRILNCQNANSTQMNIATK